MHARGLETGRAVRALEGRVVANLFFEGSTRTRLSFERAAKALGADVLNFTAQTSSVPKGETLVDTARNVEALGAAALVIRHAASGAAYLASRHVQCAVVNAGDGTHEHPSQALLDAFTLHERWGSLDGRTVAIVGDVLHSRVARSNLYCLTRARRSGGVCRPPDADARGPGATRGDGSALARRGPGGGGRGHDAPGPGRAPERQATSLPCASTRGCTASPRSAPSGSGQARW